MTGRLLYSMSVSLDGYAAAPDGSIDWVTVDDELHRAFNDEARQTDLFLHGRRMHELMDAYWPTALDEPGAAPAELEFAVIYRDTPKVVYARTLDAVSEGCELVRGDAVDDVRRRRSEGHVMGLGGPTLAAPLIAAGLVDEITMYVNPVILGGGLPFLPALDAPLRLRLVEVRAFASGVVRLRHEVLR